MLSTKLGKEVNSNKRGLERTSFPCQVLEKRYSLHWASGNRASAGDVICRSTVSVCFTSIICEGSTDLNLLWFLRWDTFSLVWCPVQALQGFKVDLVKEKRGLYKLHASRWHVSIIPLAVIPPLQYIYALGNLDLTCLLTQHAFPFTGVAQQLDLEWNKTTQRSFKEGKDEPW